MYIKIDLTFMAEGDRIGKSVGDEGGSFSWILSFSEVAIPSQGSSRAIP